MELVKHELTVPKETKEAIDLIKAIAMKLKAGESLVSYTDLVDEAVVAFKGAELIGDEIKSEHKEDIAAYLMKEVGSVFI